MVERVQTLPDGELGQECLLCSDFLLEDEGRMQVFWIPFERLNPRARIAIIGLTPGWYQMQQAFTAARDALRVGVTDEIAVLEYVDRQAGFAGSLRTNLVGMLDAIGLPAALGVDSSAQIFDRRDDLAHGTSALGYPVFVDGKNYAGSSPRVERSPMLTAYVHQLLAAELALVPQALVLPLGNAAENCLRMLIATDQLSERRCLFGFPHPSGANGHRASRFRQNHSALTAAIARWAVEFA